MPDIAIALKQEITRLARKELRAQTDALRKAVSAYKREIAALKHRIQALEAGKRKTTQQPAAAVDTEATESRRFSAKGFAKHRVRLGLSQAEYGKLLGVTALSVYKWESGQVRPRDRYLPAIAEVRTLGKREAAKRLQA